MTVPGSAFKLLSCLGVYRNIFSNSCRSVLTSQPNAGTRRLAQNKIAELNIPKKPPKPLTPYFRFLSEHLPLVKQEHPQLKHTEIVKHCAEDWRNVHQTIKDRYMELYKKDMEAYAKEYLDYLGKLTEEQKQALSEIRKERAEDRKKRKLRKKEKDLGKPKRPQAPYFLFLHEKAKERNRKYSELAIELKEEWQNLSDSAKQKYKDQYNEQLKHYETAMKEWEKQMIKQGNTDVVRKSSFIKLDTKNKNKPKKKE